MLPILDSGLQNYKRINSLFLSHRVGGNFLWQSQETNTRSKRLWATCSKCVQLDRGGQGEAGSEGWTFDLNLARQIRFPLAGKEPEGPSRKRNQHVRKHGDEKV